MDIHPGVLNTFLKFGPFLASFPHLSFINFLTQFNNVLQSSVLLLCCHIHTIDDFFNYGTLLSPELKWPTLPESTDGGSPLSVCTSILGFSTIAHSRGSAKYLTVRANVRQSFKILPLINTGAVLWKLCRFVIYGLCSNLVCLLVQISVFIQAKSH